MSILESAENQVRSILLSQPDTAQLVVDSPPGAGKTGVVERLAIQSAWIKRERVIIATQTNGQSFDLAMRLASGWNDHPVFLFTRKGLPLPSSIVEKSNIKQVDGLDQLPSGPLVVIGNSAKWSYSGFDGSEPIFDLMLVDEAYQLRDSQFAQISNLARRHVLVGDPGQIAPVTSVDIRRWQSMPDGPHVPAPKALLHRRPEQTLRMMMPASRRLPADTVELVQPLFYPELPFQATSQPGDRKLLLEKDSGHRWDTLLDQAAAGQSINLGELAARTTGEFDPELSGEVVGLITRLLERRAKTFDDGKTESLTAEQIGVVCAHRSQVYAVQEALGQAGLEGVYVETADRYQGLERQVMIVHHPLSGRTGLPEFGLDSGRMCVMLSRHRICCFVLARAGLQERLRGASGGVARILGAGEDRATQGKRVHLALLERMRGQGRIIAPDTSETVEVEQPDRTRVDPVRQP